MRFKQYLDEMAEIENGQEEMESEESEDLSQVNFRLADELDDTFISPESGILAIRRVLEKFDLELSTLYGVSLEGEEVVTDIGKTRIYILYSPTDDGRYEFYAEIGDDERMEELMSDEELDEEEE
jgi:hypothetical protein